MASSAKPSPAVSFVGRHNSGKTTLLVKLIEEMTRRGHNIGTIKHHGHADFDIDYPGKDSFRHREAGSCDTVICSPIRYARVMELSHDLECNQIVEWMPGHDLVIVEGFRQSGLDTIEVIRRANERDQAAAQEYLLSGTVRGGVPVAVVTDYDEVSSAAASRGVHAFGLEDISAIADYLEQRYLRIPLTVVIQAGGESRRMGQNKSLVPFLGKPLISHLVERFAPIADELIVTTNEPERLGFLEEETNGVVRLVPDIMDQRGALPGLRTALRAATCPLVGIIACDMIFASPNLLLAESQILQAERDLQAVVPFTKGGFEPFHAVYRRDEALAVLEAGMQADLRSARGFVGALSCHKLTTDELLAAEPRGCCFVNVNTPEELAFAERLMVGE